MIIRFKNLYLKSPTFLQQGVRLIPYAYRMGRIYRKTLRFVLESDKWNQAQNLEYQSRALSELLDLAINNVPHYQRYRKLLGRDAFAILKNIEPVTKAQMQEDIERFLLPQKLRNAWHITHTGGSSGHPLRIHLNDDAVEKEWAFMTAQWMRVGYHPGDKRVTFRGVEFKGERTICIKPNPVYNEILLSPFHLTDDKLEQYVAAIRKAKPKFLRGYPSALTILARYIEEKCSDDFPRPTALLCASEGFAPGQREYLESVFRARCYSWYGMTEKVVLAGECEHSSHYHCFPQYGITEIEEAHGRITSEPGATGEIVGTGFLNHAMPFIRYKLQDFATIIGDFCPQCRRHHLLLGEVSGHRIQDVIVGKSGALISMTALNLHDDTFTGVRQFQFHQAVPGKVTLNLRVANGFTDEHRSLIIKSLVRRTGDDVNYEIKLVDKIAQTNMGKGVYLRQEIEGGDSRLKTRSALPQTPSSTTDETP